MPKEPIKDRHRHIIGYKKTVGEKTYLLNKNNKILGYTKDGCTYSPNKRRLSYSDTLTNLLYIND